MGDGRHKGSIPKITWYILASALTFMVVEFFGDHFNGELNRDEVQKVASLSVEKVKGVA